jgi:hypothetical protein
MHTRRWTHRPPIRMQSSHPSLDGVTSSTWSRWVQSSAMGAEPTTAGHTWPVAPDWMRWHDEYDRPGTRLNQRLAAVRAQIAGALDRAAPGPIQVVSMCAGQGRDLLGVLAEHPRRGDVRGRLVELDPRNVAVARAAAPAAVKVVQGDATTTSAYDGAVPADLVLVCGVFGHATDEEIHWIVDHLPMLCATGATVVWTRGGQRQPDLRPSIRSWFAGAGFEEVARAGGDDGTWGVGAHRLMGEPKPFRAGVRLFTFVDELP